MHDFTLLVVEFLLNIMGRITIDPPKVVMPRWVLILSLVVPLVFFLFCGSYWTRWYLFGKPTVAEESLGISPATKGESPAQKAKREEIRKKATQEEPFPFTHLVLSLLVLSVVCGLLTLVLYFCIAFPVLLCFRLTGYPNLKPPQG